MSVKDKKETSFILLNKPIEWIVLSFALIITISAWLVSSRLVTKSQNEQFIIRTKEITEAISIRLRLYEQVLAGSAAMFLASTNINRDEWHIYADSLQLKKKWPGLQGLGYSIPVSAADHDSHIAAIRAEGFPDFTITPAGERAEYSSIIYLEPFDWRNQRAFGYDMWSNDMRREAMKLARDTGQAATSGPITLVQETEENTQKGFLMYVPVYSEHIKTLATLQEKRAAFKGWVYSPFRIGDLMEGILGSDQKNVEYEIFDSDDISPQSKLFSNFDDRAAKKTDLSITRKIDLPQRQWTIVFRPGTDEHTSFETYIPTIIGIVGLLVDILIYYLMATIASTGRQAQKIAQTRTRQLEIEKQKAEEASTYKSQFLSSMSHELRSPLNSIMSYAQLALVEKTPSPMPDSTRDYITTISKAGDHLLSVISDILDFSKIEAGAMHLEEIPFSLQTVIDDTINMMAPLANEKNLIIDVSLADDIPATTLGDPAKIRQVLLNLLSNALKFTKEGSVRVKASVEKREEGAVTVLVSIEDTGIGISQDQQSNLFEAFEQADMSISRKFGGTGLGLAICKHIISLMKGAVGFTSEKGTGSCFWFTVPLLEIASTPNEDDKTTTEGTDKKILLVEDITINLIVAQKLLQNHGFSVTPAMNGLEALRCLETQNFDVILMDIHMPEMDGIEATKCIRAIPDKAKSTIPIIALTADVDADNVRAYLASGMNAYCAKPLQISALLETINSISSTVEHNRPD